MTDTTPAVIVIETDSGATMTVELVDDQAPELIEIVAPTAIQVVQITDGGLPGPPGETTVEVFTYTDEADSRPAGVSVVFWIPDPFDLPNPIGAIEGDLVLRSTPDVITGMTGTTGIWTGTAAEYEALPDYDDDVIYFIVPTP